MTKKVTTEENAQAGSPMVRELSEMEKKLQAMGVLIVDDSELVSVPVRKTSTGKGFGNKLPQQIHSAVEGIAEIYRKTGKVDYVLPFALPNTAKNFQVNWKEWVLLDVGVTTSKDGKLAVKILNDRTVPCSDPSQEEARINSIASCMRNGTFQKPAQQIMLKHDPEGFQKARAINSALGKSYKMK